MATKLKVVEQIADIVPAPQIPESARIDFDPAPTRKQKAGWTADKQRKFIEHLALTGSVGEAAAIAGVSSRSAYRLRNKAGAESFARAWDAALSLCATRLAAIAFDRALHGRSERFYRDGELVMERKMPSDYLLTWLLSRLDPLQFGSPTANACLPYAKTLPLVGTMQLLETNGISNYTALQVTFQRRFSKGLTFFRRLSVPILANVSHLGDRPHVKDLIGTVKVMLDAYRGGELDRLLLVNAQFVNTMTQKPAVEQLLPIEALVVPDSSATRGAYAQAFAAGPLSRGTVARARVIRIDESMLTRPGPRVFDALDALARELAR